MDGGGQQIPNSSPRFTSFRPPASVSQTRTGIASRNASPSHDPNKSGTRRHQYGGRQRAHHSISRDSLEPSLASSQQFVDWHEASPYFVTDLKGDVRNLEDGSSHGVPPYRRPTLAGSLGSTTVLESSAHYIGQANCERDSISKHIRPDLKRQKYLRINPDVPSTLQDNGGADYVSFRSPKGRKRKREKTQFERLSSPNPFQPQAIIKGGSQSVCTLDAVVQSTTDESGSGEDGLSVSAVDEGFQRKKAALLRHVDQTPTDWKSWIALVGLRNEMNGFHEVCSRPMRTNAERRSNAEVDLSIYGKALKSVVDSEGREQLYVSMMSKAPEVWERSMLSSIWQTIIEEHPLSLRLWKRYLNFHQSTFTGFTLGEIRKQYLKSLDILQKARGGVNKAQIQHSRIYMVQIYVLLRLSLLYREAGYAEISVAIWQALLEFEFNRPPHLRHRGQDEATDAIHKEALSAFESFWDSEAPRIGEANAQGWSNFTSDEVSQCQPSQAAGSPFEAGINTIRLWADAEHKASAHSFTQARTVDESLDDPYRVVLFSDIRFALIKSPSPSDHRTVLMAFLCFCHLPPMLDESSRQTEAWFDDQFVRNQILYDDQPSVDRWLGRPSSLSPDNHDCPSNNTGDLRASSLPRAFDLTMVNYEVSSDTLFSGSGQWFSAFGPWLRSGPTSSHCVLRTLQMLVSEGVGGDGLAEYILALELYISPTTVRKSAKNFLKKRPSSLRLYNAYAMIESHLGNREAANKIYEIAIRMSAKLDEAASRNAILLWRSRMWQHLSVGETSLALHHLSRYGLDGIVDERPDANGKRSDVATSTARLQLRNALTAGRDHMLSLGLSIQAISFCELLFLDDYLVNHLSLQAAQTSFKTNLHLLIEKFPADRAAEALFRQSFARLLYTHVVHKYPYSPSTIRSFLAESITALPHNTIFLSLYAWNEARFRIDDRVRGIVRDTVFASNRHDEQGGIKDESDHITTHFFAIYTDLQRGLVQGSNQNAIRGTFERALASEGVAHSAGLWKLYFLFEHRNRDPKRARDVLFRAIRACPWVKAIYMLAFECLGDEMGNEDLRGIYDMMVEKELRIHVAL
ncbi:MAG: hypothetical protein Q9201_000339 [Fulgogasparrea decipioides]